MNARERRREERAGAGMRWSEKGAGAGARTKEAKIETEKNRATLDDGKNDNTESSKVVNKPCVPGRVYWGGFVLPWTTSTSDAAAPVREARALDPLEPLSPRSTSKKTDEAEEVERSAKKNHNYYIDPRTRQLCFYNPGCYSYGTHYQCVPASKNGCSKCVEDTGLCSRGCFRSTERCCVLWCTSPYSRWLWFNFTLVFAVVSMLWINSALAWYKFSALSYTGLWYQNVTFQNPSLAVFGASLASPSRLHSHLHLPQSR